MKGKIDQTITMIASLKGIEDFRRIFPLEIESLDERSNKKLRNYIWVLLSDRYLEVTPEEIKQTIFTNLYVGEEIRTLNDLLRMLAVRPFYFRYLDNNLDYEDIQARANERLEQLRNGRR